MKNYPVNIGILISNYKDPVMNQSGFHGVSFIGVVFAIAPIFLTTGSEVKLLRLKV